MREVIKVSKWETFKQIERLHYEVDAYIRILDFLMDNKQQEKDIFAYYENKYLKTHINYVYAKKEFEEQIKKELMIEEFAWEVDFESGEATIHD